MIKINLSKNELSEVEEWVDFKIWEFLSEGEMKHPSIIYGIIDDLEYTLNSNIREICRQALNTSDIPNYINTEAWAKIATVFAEDQKNHYDRFISSLEKAAKAAQNQHLRGSKDYKDYQYDFYTETDKLVNTFPDTYRFIDGQWGYDANTHKEALEKIAELKKASYQALDRLKLFFEKALPNLIKENKRYFFEMLFGEKEFSAARWAAT